MGLTNLNILAPTIRVSGAGNSETLDTTKGVVLYDPNGASRTGVILEVGTVNGQEVVIVNTADANETITFAAAGTSNVAGGTGVSLAQNTSKAFTWDKSTARWYPRA